MPPSKSRSGILTKDKRTSNTFLPKNKCLFIYLDFLKTLSLSLSHASYQSFINKQHNKSDKIQGEEHRDFDGTGWGQLSSGNGVTFGH